MTKPLSERLTSDGSASDSFLVPQGSSLYVTDLVFSNPQGDFGRASVLLDDEPLFEVALENFRDLDYHFVTPITAKSGQLIELEVECREPGKPPAAPKADACDIAVYVGGEELLPDKASP